MEAPDLQQAIEEIRRYIRRAVAAGFDTPNGIIENAAELLSDQHDPKTLRPHAERLTQEALQAHLREQATWPDVTDCDRLEDAFADLERKGIVCRQNFTCCSNCGRYEIGDEMRNACAGGCDVRGYAFYHMQDTESATQGCGLYLNYGSVGGTEAEGTHIGHEIVDALNRHGLKTRWDGSFSNRIFVEVDWKRRRPFEVAV
jgi:hypothetical protein